MCAKSTGSCQPQAATTDVQSSARPSHRPSQRCNGLTYECLAWLNSLLLHHRLEHLVVGPAVDACSAQENRRSVCDSNIVGLFDRFERALGVETFVQCNFQLVWIEPDAFGR